MAKSAPYFRFRKKGSVPFFRFLRLSYSPPARSFSINGLRLTNVKTSFDAGFGLHHWSILEGEFPLGQRGRSLIVHYALKKASSLPPANRRAALTVYLTLQLAGGAARHVAVAPGGLLPRLFTLTTERWRLFSVTLTLRSPPASR